MTPCSFLYIQKLPGKKDSRPPASTVKKKAIASFETSVPVHHTARYDVQGNRSLKFHYVEKVKSHRKSQAFNESYPVAGQTWLCML